jgi:hypothetical protein
MVERWSQAVKFHHPNQQTDCLTTHTNFPMSGVITEDGEDFLASVSS